MFVGRLEINNDYPGFFGLDAGGILAVKTGLGDSSNPWNPDDPREAGNYAAHSAVFRRTEDFYLAARQNAEDGISPFTDLEIPMWFDTGKESSAVIRGLHVFARHNQLPTEPDKNASLKFGIAAAMAGKTVASQITEQVISSMQAQELAAQISAYKEHLDSFTTTD